MEPLLALGVERHDGTTLVRIAGEVDMASAPQLRACLLEADGNVVVDLRGVSFLDASGIGVLAEADQRLGLSGGKLTLRQPQGIVRRALEVIGLIDWIEE